MFANNAKQGFSRDDWLLVKGGFTCRGCRIFSISFRVFLTLRVHVCLSQVDLLVQHVRLFPLNYGRETDVNEGRRIVKVHHFGGQVLSASVVQSHRAIFATGHKQIAGWRVGNRPNRFVELSEAFCYTCLFNVENAHGS